MPNLVLTRRVCPTCSVEYALPTAVYESARATGQDWFCPNGHRLHFPRKAPEPKVTVPPENAAMAAEIERLKARVRQLEDDCNCALELAEAESEERRRLHHRLTGAKYRARAIRQQQNGGCCPWCHNSFANLKAHLAAAHQGFQQNQRNIA